jgi:hypothetical protein
MVGGTYRQVFPPGAAARPAVGITLAVEAEVISEEGSEVSGPASPLATVVDEAAEEVAIADDAEAAEEATEGAARADEAADEAAEMTAAGFDFAGEGEADSVAVAEAEDDAWLDAASLAEDEEA